MAFVSGLFVVVVASTGLLALVLWGVRGLYEVPAIGHKACPPTMGDEPPRAIKHPAVIGLVLSPGRTGSPARGSYGFRKRPLRRSRCEHEKVLLFPTKSGWRRKKNKRGQVSEGFRLHLNPLLQPGCLLQRLLTTFLLTFNAQFNLRTPFLGDSANEAAQSASHRTPLSISNTRHLIWGPR